MTTVSQEAREAAANYNDMAYAKSIVEAVEQGCTFEDRCLAVSDLLARHRHQAERETLARMEWRGNESAPKDGTHFLACTGGYGEHWTFNQRPPVVVHYWSNPGEEGFYLSTGLVEGSYNDVPLDLQWWKPLGPEPLPPAPEAGQ